MGRTVTFALEDRSNGAIVGIDEFAWAESLALGQPTRLVADSVIGRQGGLQLTPQAFPLVRGHTGGALEALLGSLGQGDNGAAMRQELLFGLAHQADEDFALAAALAAKAAHDLRKGVVERLGLRLQQGRGRGALRRDSLDELEDFFWAL